MTDAIATGLGVMLGGVGIGTGVAIAIGVPMLISLSKGRKHDVAEADKENTANEKDWEYSCLEIRHDNESEEK